MKIAQTDSHARPSASSPHVCPWWLGPLLTTPLRRLIDSPERMLEPFVRPGMTVVEPGCGMGYFTLPMARLVGETGKVLAADVQPKMLGGLMRRARRAGLDARITPVQCQPGDAGLEAWPAAADVAVVIHMLHEVPDQAGLLRQLFGTLKPGGVLVFVEPKGHVTAADFQQSLAAATAVGFVVTERVVRGRGLNAVLIRP